MRGRAPSPFPEGAREAAENLPSPAPEAEEPGDEDDPHAIPPLANMAPAIFVPAVGDYTEPQPWEPDASKRLQSVIAELDAHAAAVKINIQAMITREATRLQRECARSEAALWASSGQAPWPTRAQVSPADEAALMASLNCCVELNANFADAPPEIMPNFSYRDIQERLPNPRDTPRERALTQLLSLARRGMCEVDGYATYMQNVKNTTMQAYAAEIARERRAEPGTGGHETTTPMDLS